MKNEMKTAAIERSNNWYMAAACMTNSAEELRQIGNGLALVLESIEAEAFPDAGEPDTPERRRQRAAFFMDRYPQYHTLMDCLLLGIYGICDTLTDAGKDAWRHCEGEGV